MALIDNLVNKYARADLKSIFTKVGLANIPDSAHDRLRTVTVAQWLLESQSGTSIVATTANNFAGLAWRKEMAGFATQVSIKVPPEEIAIEFCQFPDLDAFITGYWKFLTRSVYAGLADNTDSADRFIGFIQRQGFSSSPTYISRVLALMPESQSRLTKAKGESEAGPAFTFQITSYPQEVGVGEEFIVTGNAPMGEVGKPIKVLWDGKYPAADGVVGSDNRWRLALKLAQVGDRRLRVTLGTQSKEVTIEAKNLPDSDKDREAPNPVGAIALKLTGSVGAGGKNQGAEVIAVKSRLVQLGFNWIGDPNNASVGTGFIYTIRLFQSIVAGNSNLSGDGRIDVGGMTHRWLQASNAPQWLTMPDSDPQINFVNYEKAQTNDDHDFGTDWLRDVILNIAREYHKTSTKSAPFTINDVSRPQGGDTPDHSGHETGLMCDVNLPRTDGKAGSITWRDPLFDRSATRKLIVAMRKQPLVRAVYLNDPTLINEDLCGYSGGHDDHIHFEIKPPVRN